MIQNFQDEVCFVLDTMKGTWVAPTNEDAISIFNKELLRTSSSEGYF